MAGARAGRWHAGIVRRRGFLIGSVAGAALAGCRPWTRTPADAPDDPDDHELAVLAAIADTFLPGDDGSPGAHEVNAIARIVDPAYPVSHYLSKVVGDLDAWCLSTKGKGFLGLSRRDRERALEQRMGLHGKLIRSLYHEVYAGILVLTKLAFFGAIASPFGTNYLGFPVASRGYAPGSAAGAWASRDRPWTIAPGAGSTIDIDGRGAITSVRLSAFAISEAALHATLRLRAPSGAHRELALHTTDGEGWLIHQPVALAGGAAEGAWRLEVVSRTGTGTLAHWSLVVRTELDDEAAAG